MGRRETHALGAQPVHVGQRERRADTWVGRQVIHKNEDNVLPGRGLVLRGLFGLVDLVFLDLAPGRHTGQEGCQQEKYGKGCQTPR